MPCIAPVRGKTDLINPWEPKTDNDPCGQPALVTVGSVNVANENLCKFHWIAKNGYAPFAAAMAPGGGGVTDDGVWALDGGGPGVDFAQPGVYVPATGPFGGQTGSYVLVNGNAWLNRFVAPKAMTITRIRFAVVVAASADDPCDWGIYSASGLNLSLLGSSGATTGLLNSTGVKTATLTTPVSLAAGQVYYSGLGAGPLGGTGAQLLFSQMVGAGAAGSALFGGGAPTAETFIFGSRYPLPASIVTAPVNYAAYGPIMALLQ